MIFLHTILIFILSITSFSIFIVTNPVHAVLILIAMFCESAVILFLFGIDFLSLVLIIVYVGAIAVLFLFIVMMSPLKKDKYLTEGVSIPLLIMATSLVLLFKFSIQNIPIHKFMTYNTLSLKTDILTHMDVIGQVLYTEFLLCFLIIGLILLVAIIGSISITLNYSNNLKKREFVDRQLAKADNTILFFK